MDTYPQLHARAEKSEKPLIQSSKYKDISKVM